MLAGDPHGQAVFGWHARRGPLHAGRRPACPQSAIPCGLQPDAIGPVGTAETAVATAIIINIFRNTRNIEVKSQREMKW